MKQIFFFVQPLVGFVQWFRKSVIAPENGGETLPPIRFDGDPTDVYLA